MNLLKPLSKLMFALIWAISAVLTIYAIAFYLPHYAFLLPIIGTVFGVIGHKILFGKYVDKTKQNPS